MTARHRTVTVRHAPPPVRPVYERSRYQPVPVVAYPAPRPRYVAQPVFVRLPHAAESQVYRAEKSSS